MNRSRVASKKINGKSERSRRRILRAALDLFSKQGYRGTTTRQIAKRSGISVGNLYHHFRGKEAVFQALIDEYWEKLLDPELRLNEVFNEARFPDDLELMAEAIEDVVRRYHKYIKLIYIDVVEAKGQHIRDFYRTMADRYRRVYGEAFDRRKAEGGFGDVDPMIGVMMASRWLFSFFTVEMAFGAKHHLGVAPETAVEECIRIFRYGLLPRGAEQRPAGSGGESARGRRSR